MPRKLRSGKLVGVDDADIGVVNRRARHTKRRLGRFVLGNDGHMINTDVEPASNGGVGDDGDVTMNDVVADDPEDEPVVIRTRRAQRTPPAPPAPQAPQAPQAPRDSPAPLANASSVPSSTAPLSNISVRSLSRKRKTVDTNQKPKSNNKSTSQIWDAYKYSEDDFRNLTSAIDMYSNIDRASARKSKRRRKMPKSSARKSQPVFERRMTRSMTKRQIEVPPADDQTPTIDATEAVQAAQDPMLGWISATKTKYYLLGDTCLDWLYAYYVKYGLTTEDMDDDQKRESAKLMKDASHLELLFECGNTFEEKIYEELKSMFKDQFTLIFDENDYQVFRAERSMNGFIRQKYDQTMAAMLRGVPVIAQAVMINDSNMTYGIADLLVRSDYLSCVFSQFGEDPEVIFPAPKIGATNYHYRVIDCKWTTMTLCTNGMTVRNEGFFPAYKGQLAIYTSCLEQMQGYIPTKAYVMAKAWRIGAQRIPKGQEHLYRGYSAFDRAGVIDYAGRDESYVIKTRQAIQWAQRVVTEGRTWRYGPTKPTVPEMYPNMNKSYNPAFDGVKKELAEKYGEITQLWYANEKNRNEAHKHGITDVRDRRLTLEMMGITSKARGPIQQAIIDINSHGQTEDVVRPAKISTNTMHWQSRHALDYYVDFETIGYNLFVRPGDMDIDQSYVDSDVTFMIGIGYVYDPLVSTERLVDALKIDRSRCSYSHNIDHNEYMGQKWEFLCLYLTNFRIENELELFRLFFQFTVARNCIMNHVHKLRPQNDDLDYDSRIFHWTGAELTFMDRAVERMKSDRYDSVLRSIYGDSSDEMNAIKREVRGLIRCFEDTIAWVDLCAEMQKEPVAVRNCYRYKLKHFANAMQHHGLIRTNWGDGKMSDGFRAMLEAIQIYRNSDNVDTTNTDFKSIVDYNEVDCRVMWEIIEYLREHHI